MLQKVRSETGAAFIPPFDHPHTIAGQSTVGQELFEQAPDLDTVIVPVGGGGLLSGVALSAFHFAGELPVYGAEPLGADDAYRSFTSGVHITAHVPNTIADGLRTTLGELPFEIIRKYVSGILTATEPQIVEAMKYIWSHLRVVAEPSGALGLAALLANRKYFAGKKVGVVISGGNIDLDKIQDYFII
jgi:threonine dehydratase